MTYSYEEIRNVALDLLAGRESPVFQLTQYLHFLLCVGAVFAKREGRQNEDPNHHHLTIEEKEIFREVFWDFFRQGIITLGVNDHNGGFPWFKVTDSGMKIIKNQSGYFFHNVSSYEEIITSEIPSINKDTLLYLKEAMQAFQSGCLLSSTVMLGVATEHTFNLLLEATQENSLWETKFSKVGDEWGALRQINKFKEVLDKNAKDIPKKIKEDLDTHFFSIVSVIRTFRNESGHPTGKIVSREQAFVLLQLFIPYCKKLYALMEFFSATKSTDQQPPAPTEPSSPSESVPSDE